MTSAGATLGICLWLAWGLATSPLPIAALAVLLLSDRPVAASATFTAVWTACQAVGMAVMMTAAAGAVAAIHIDRQQQILLGWCAVALAAIMFVIALALWLRGRRHPDPERGRRTRELLDTAERAGPRQAAGMALVLSLLNLTNVPYWAGIGLMLTRSDLPFAPRTLIWLASAVMASITLIAICLVVWATGDRLRTALEKGRRWVVAHSGSVAPGVLGISAFLLLLVGASDLGWLPFTV